MNNIYLVQAQYHNIFNNRKQYWIPYTVGCLWAYAKTFSFVTDNFYVKDIIYDRENHKDIIDRLDNPTIVFFSNYVWNEQYNLKLAEKIKNLYPKVTVVFGGPQSTQHLLDSSFVDIVVFYEGEQSFVNILRDYLDGTLKKAYASKRIDDLSLLPSPYTSGVFDEILKRNNDFWQVTLETNRGCPFSCTFCDWGSLTLSKIKKISLSRLEDELKWITENKVSFVYLADANFGIFKQRDYEIAILIKEYFDRSTVDGFFTNYTKNSSDSVIDIFKVLEKYSTRGMTLALQSMNKDVLSTVKRKNLSSDSYSSLFKRLNEEKIPYYVELILGLPNETLISWKNGLCELLELGVHDKIDFWTAEVLPNSELGDPVYIKEHGIQVKTVPNFINIYNTQDSVDEKSRIVVSTNTMSSEDMIEAYMFAWMIQSFHSQGYSQVQSRLARKKGIPYKTFYEKLHKKIQQIEPFKTHYFTVKKEITKIYSFDTQSASNDFIAQPPDISFDFLNNNLSLVTNLLNKVLSDFEIDNNIYTKLIKDTIITTQIYRKKEKQAV